MPNIQPKISISNSHEPATKQFTDRIGFIEAFWNSIDSIQNDDTKVLVYYGVGGVGKTSLRKKLQSEIDNSRKNILWASIDFEIKQHRDVDNALLFLGNELSKKYQINFNLFDFAYAYYLKKVSPQIPLDEKSLPFLEEGSLISDILTVFSDIPLLGIPTKVASLLNKGNKIYKDWVTQKRIENIVDMSLKEPKELLSYLPAYFAEDIKTYINTKDKKAVVFIDTYESLNSEYKNDKTFFEVDEWLREVLIPNLSGVLFVIFGRQKLKWKDTNSAWNECIEQHLIGNLDDADAKFFLESAGIRNDDILNSIIQISEGHPYSLDLCVDTYVSIQRERTALKEDFNFNNNKKQIFDRFIKYLQISERETLKILSVPRFWDDQTFELLIKEYNTGYPISAIKEFCEFSFINERILNNTWEMHSLMRKSLTEILDKKQLIKTHKILFDFYSNKLTENNNKVEEVYLNEAFFHGKNCMEKDDFAIWFVDKTSYFLKTGNILFLKDLIQELLEDLKEESDEYRISDVFSQLSFSLGKIYITLGNYLKAQDVLKYAESIGSTIDRTNITSLLAVLYKNTYNLIEAESYFMKALKAYKEIDLINHDIRNSISMVKLHIEYGKFKVYLSENYEALDIYNKVIFEIDSLLKLNLEKYTLLNCKAVALEKLGELNGVLGNYQISGELYKNAIEIYDLMINKYELSLENSSDLIYLMNNKGMAYKRLAEYYVESNDFDKSKQYYRKAIEIYENSKETFSENVDTYKKIGFATRGLLRQLVNDNSAKDEMELIFDKCLEAFNKALELSPKDASAKHSLGGAYKILGKMYSNKLDYTKACELFNISIEHSVEAIGMKPDYLYAYDGKAETLMYIADINVKMCNIEKALTFFDEALIAINEILKRTPKAIYALEKKNAIDIKIKELKN